MQRLVTIIREDLSPGYQLAQSTHSAVEFALVHGYEAWKWHNKSNYVLVVSTEDESKLEWYADQLGALNVKFKMFYEPDVDQFTSLTFLSTSETDELTDGMPLAGGHSGSIDKDHKGE